MQALDFIKRFIKQNGYSPTFTEIGEALGAHKTSIRVMIKAMIKKGYLGYEAGSWRGIRLIGS